MVENFTIAELSDEQLEVLNLTEKVLGVTLIAYETKKDDDR